MRRPMLVAAQRSAGQRSEASAFGRRRPLTAGGLCLPRPAHPGCQPACLPWRTGRVEFYGDSWGKEPDWGTICDNEWGEPEAKVVCRELKLNDGTGASAVFQPGIKRGPEEMEIWMSR